MGSTEEGLICQLGQARGMNKALDKMIQDVIAKTKNCENRVLAISHCNCPERAKAVKEKIETEVVNKGSVNINVFVKNQAKGRPDRQLMKGVTRKVKSALRNITPPFGMYWKSRIVWSEPLGEAKEGFDCTNIRFEVITEID